MIKARPKQGKEAPNPIRLDIAATLIVLYLAGIYDGSKQAKSMKISDLGVSR